MENQTNNNPKASDGGERRLPDAVNFVKGKIEVGAEETQLAVSLMHEIAYDNGFFDRWNPEKYAAKWVNKIGPIAKYFFDNNPSVLNDEDIEEICAGEISEVLARFGSMLGFAELHTVLNDYFENH